MAARPYNLRDPSARNVDNRRVAISYLIPLLAVVAGIVHAGLSPVITVADVKPDLLLVGVVLVTSLGGLGWGATWAFVGGLTANLLVGEPLGSVPLAMLLVSALVAGGSRAFGGLIWIYPVVATFAGSVVADLVGLMLKRLVAEPFQAGVPTELLLAAATLNAAIAALLLFPARTIATRYVSNEGSSW